MASRSMSALSEISSGDFVQSGHCFKWCLTIPKSIFLQNKIQISALLMLIFPIPKLQNPFPRGVKKNTITCSNMNSFRSHPVIFIVKCLHIDDIPTLVYIVCICINQFDFYLCGKSAWGSFNGRWWTFS